jgi:hypothetical protein
VATPRVAFEAALKVTTWELVAVTVKELGDAVTFTGIPLKPTLTCEPNPFTAVIETVVDTDPPCPTTTVAGRIEIEKSGTPPPPPPPPDPPEPPPQAVAIQRAIRIQTREMACRGREGMRKIVSG